MTSALAIVCVRNESLHIRRCLRDFIESGIEVALIDNDSTDDTIEKAREFLGHGLLGIDRQPWRGHFSLAEQLEIKADIAARSRHDWILHADADERLTSRSARYTLRHVFADADANGYTCVNFNEFVFVALPGENFERENYADAMSTYYFFQPYYPRAMRAWRRDSGLGNLASGGHLLTGAHVRKYPVDQIYRHYLMLGEATIRNKYLGREFAENEIAKGWHGNRIAIEPDRLTVLERPELRRLSDPASREFDTSAPLDEHFWQWPREYAV